MDVTTIIPAKPEEEKLAKKRRELADLEIELAERELYLAGLRATLSAFERRYLEIVGVRYATLDEIEAEIAELSARYEPSNQATQDKATHARASANESHAAASPQDSTGPRKFAPSPALKELYREVAKRIHPDLTTDPVERNAAEAYGCGQPCL